MYGFKPRIQKRRSAKRFIGGRFRCAASEKTKNEQSEHIFFAFFLNCRSGCSQISSFRVYKQLS